MNQFLLLFSIFIFTCTSHCSAQSSDEIENSKIYSSNECYTILKKLGEGAFGKVYEVEDSAGKKFALKSIETEGSLGFYEDAEREFNRGQLLDHHNIIKSFDVFDYALFNGKSTKNIVLQLVSGNPLYKINGRILEKNQGIEAVKCFCEAITYALSLNLLHLDLHQGNVMISEEGEAMIIDLASFFTYDEILSWVGEQLSDESHSDSTQLQANAFAEDFEKKYSREKDGKIKQFFSQNPELLAHIQKEQKVRNELWQRKMEVQADDQNSSHAHYLPPIDISPIEANYFSRVTEICMGILRYSSIERDEKVNLMIEIKKLAWYYHEDIEDKENRPLDFYLNKLLEISNCSILKSE